MRFLVLTMILGFATGMAYADGGAHLVQKFDGAGTPASTATFTVQDKWEVVWVAQKPVNLTVLTPDGKVVSGTHGTKGSFYQPKGGTFYLQLESDRPDIAWHVLVAEVALGTNLAAADATGMFANAATTDYAPPTSVLHPGVAAPTPAPVASSDSAQNPFGTMAPSPTSAYGTPSPSPAQPKPAPKPAPKPPPPPVVDPAVEEAKAVVLIKGDKAEGTGFFVKTPDGPAIITNTHIIANNPNLKITTYNGAFVTMLSAKGASDRDLAELAVTPGNYNYLDVAGDISQVVQPGDEIVTPGNNQGSEVLLNAKGKVVGIGPVKIDIENPRYHGTSGGPVIHTSSGKVLGVMTEALKTDMFNNLNKVPFARRSAAANGLKHFVALRLDSIVDWVAIDSKRFLIESTFLDQFHEQSRRLDAYLNGSEQKLGNIGEAATAAGNAESTAGGTTDTSENAATIYLGDEKIMKANDTYQQSIAEADASQRIEALRALLFDLQCVADINVDQIQNLSNFYSFDKDRAQEELAYRKALRAELDANGDVIERLGDQPRTDN